MLKITLHVIMLNAFLVQWAPIPGATQKVNKCHFQRSEGLEIWYHLMVCPFLKEFCSWPYRVKYINNSSIFLLDKCY